jgi:hypothetical protein
MAYWKTEYGFAPQFTQPAPSRRADLAALVLVGVASGVLVLWFIPLPLVVPALGIVSFVIACVVAFLAYHSGVDSRAPGITSWDIAAVFTLIWIGAGVVCGPKYIVELFERLTMVP